MSKFAVALVLLASVCTMSHALLGEGVGAPNPEDIHSQEAMEAAQTTIEKLNSDYHALLSASLGPSTHRLTLLGIKDFKSQVVAGINYMMTLHVKDSSGSEFDIETRTWYRAWLVGKNGGEPAWQVTSVQRMDA